MLVESPSAVSDFLLTRIEVENLPTNREIYCSKVYSHNDKNLLKVILSTSILVNMFDITRRYIRISQNGWSWKKYQKSHIDNWKENVTLKPPPKNTTMKIF